MRKLTYSVVVLLVVLSTLPMNVFALENQVIEVENSKESIDIENSNEDSEVKDEKSQEDKEQSDQKESKEKSSKVDQAEGTDQKTKIKEEQNTPEAEEDKQAISKEKTEESKPKKNENGIVEGTKVYGIDISKFSEEELQYIPKGWRDGVTLENSEHPHGTDEFGPRARAAYPNVNNYIKQNKLKPVRVKTEYKSQFPKFNYRFNRPEGVVAHETANNSSTIRGEINYMTRNYNNAFVHAFVDGRNVIEIHPTRYGAWGAGYYGNQRFIHVELVRVDNFDEFARSINNYAEYIASLLYQYNLGVTSAEASGSGTLWSHKAVSNYLGGTTHVDPHGYFAKYGYNWTEFTKLVKTKYNSISVEQTANAVKEKKVSRVGQLKNSNVKIYKDVLDQKKTVSTKPYMNSVYYIKSQKTYQGKTYYLMSSKPSSTEGTIGWVKSTDVKTYTHKHVDKKAKTFYLKGKGVAYNRAWGGTENLVYASLKSMKGEKFNVHMTEEVGGNTWYRGTLKGKTVWIHSSHLEQRTITKTSRVGQLKNSKVTISKTLDNNSKTVSTKPYMNSVYYIKQQAKQGSTLYYLMGTKPSSTEGTIGWVKSTDVKTYTHKHMDKKAKTFYLKGKGVAYNRAWVEPKISCMLP